MVQKFQKDRATKRHRGSNPIQGVILGITLAGLGFFGVSAQASHPQDSDQIDQRTAFSLAAELVSELRPKVRSFSRPVWVFHWTDDERIFSSPRDYLIANSGRFYQAADDASVGFANQDRVGPGLYTATDPSVSRVYGSRMVALKVPKRAKFLEIPRDPVTGEWVRLLLSPELIRRLDQAGCPKLLTERKCHRVVEVAFQRLGLEVLAYKFPVHRIEGCESTLHRSEMVDQDGVEVRRTRTARAFSLIGNESGFYEHLFFERENATRSNGIFDSQIPLRPIEGQRTFLNGIFNQFFLGVTTDRVASEYANEHLYACSHRYPEDIATEVLPENEEQVRIQYRSILREAAQLSQTLGTSIDPLKFKDVIARRFILRADWQNYLQSKHYSDLIDVTEVYSPSPETWVQWQTAAERLVQPAADQDLPLTLHRLLEWNRTGLIGTLPDDIQIGVFKQTGNFGRNTRRRDALDAVSIDQLNQFRLMGESDAALSWTSLVCEEDLPADGGPDFSNRTMRRIRDYANDHRGRSDFWRQTHEKIQAGEFKREWYWYAAWPRGGSLDNARRSGARLCGMIRYPAPSQVTNRLTALLNRVNDLATTDLSDQPFGRLTLASRAQRSVVALHPFNKGNGRVSRWIMDYLLRRESLPPALVLDMNSDLSMSEEQYIFENRVGQYQGLLRMEECLGEWNAIASSTQPDVTRFWVERGRCGLQTLPGR